jgi:hypothetical protein
MLQDIRLLKKYKKNIQLTSDIKSRRLALDENQVHLTAIDAEIVKYSQEILLNDYASLARANNQLLWLDVLNGKLAQYQQARLTLDEEYQHLLQQQHCLQNQMKHSKKLIEREMYSCIKQQQDLLDKNWQKWSIEQMLWRRYG